MQSTRKPFGLRRPVFSRAVSKPVPEFFTGLVAIVLAGCAALPHLSLPRQAPPAEPGVVELSPADCLALLTDDAPGDSLRQALTASIDYLSRLPADRPLTALGRPVAAGDLRAMLDGIVTATVVGGRASDYVCDRLRVVRRPPPPSLLVTGYYQPELRASRTRSNRFQYPLYQTPTDLVDVDLGTFCPACAGRTTHGRVKNGRLVPYYSRAEIDAGALAGHEYELAWLDDPVESFFLHVQGSARLRFDDGVGMDVSYSSSNGRPYTSIGRVLVDQGKVPREAVSLQVLKDYLRAHPDEQAALLARNERYVFFRPVPVGPVGSLGVPLTAGRSVAADAGVYPAAGLAFLRIDRRESAAAEGEGAALARFVLIQDAGVAINGANRVDVFFGTGPTAEAVAGEMRNPGELYLILPRQPDGPP